MVGEGFIPVTVLTGFLGSGKTTLLRRMLASPDLADCAVLINEFGEIGLDHHLVQAVSGDLVLMQSGCICCTIRGDLSRTIRDLYDRRERGEVSAFSRLVIETTGLADPVPILQTVVADPVIQHHFQLGGVLTAVDAVNAGQQRTHQPEWSKQVTAADRLILTKTDLATTEQADEVTAVLARLNPDAALTRAEELPDVLELLRTPGSAGGRRVDADPTTTDDASAVVSSHGEHHHHDTSRHDGGIVAFPLVFDTAIDWHAFAVWLTMLLHAHGANVLRVKGLLNVGDDVPPLAVHGVQHLVHQPYHLPAWPDADRTSRLIFIVRDLDPAAIWRSFAAFCAERPTSLTTRPAPSPRADRSRAPRLRRRS